MIEESRGEREGTEGRVEQRQTRRKEKRQTR
jgi:hypothetical protein